MILGTQPFQDCPDMTVAKGAILLLAVDTTSKCARLDTIAALATAANVTALM